MVKDASCCDLPDLQTGYRILLLASGNSWWGDDETRAPIVPEGLRCKPTEKFIYMSHYGGGRETYIATLSPVLRFRPPV